MSEPLNKFLKSLPKYTRTVCALKIAHVIPNSRGVELHFVDESIIPFQLPQRWVLVHNPCVGDYLAVDHGGVYFLIGEDMFEYSYQRCEDNNNG